MTDPRQIDAPRTDYPPDSIEGQLDQLARDLAGPLGTDIRVERIRSALPAAFREYRDWGLAAGRASINGLPRLVTAVDAVLHQDPDADPVPDEEWDPVFLELREARRDLAAAPQPRDAETPTDGLCCRHGIVHRWESTTEPTERPSEPPRCTVCGQVKVHSYHRKHGRSWDVPYHPFYPPVLEASGAAPEGSETA